jgi:hypothetical protein
MSSKSLAAFSSCEFIRALSVVVGNSFAIPGAERCVTKFLKYEPATLFDTTEKISGDPD